MNSYDITDTRRNPPPSRRSLRPEFGDAFVEWVHRVDWCGHTRSERLSAPQRPIQGRLETTSGYATPAEPVGRHATDPHQGRTVAARRRRRREANDDG